MRPPPFALPPPNNKRNVTRCRYDVIASVSLCASVGRTGRRDDITVPPRGSPAPVTSPPALTRMLLPQPPPQDGDDRGAAPDPSAPRPAPSPAGRAAPRDVSTVT